MFSILEKKFKHVKAIAYFSMLLSCHVALAKPVTFQVTTFNIHHGANVADAIDLEKTAATISQQFTKADFAVVGLQEVDVKTTRSKKEDQIATISNNLKLNAFFAKCIDYKGGDYGNGVLLSPNLREAKLNIIDLPKDKERRTAMFVSFVHQEIPFCVVNAHFPLDNTEGLQSASFQLITNTLTTLYQGAVAVIMGDMNIDRYWNEMTRYYANIVGKYGSAVQKALKKQSRHVNMPARFFTP